MSRPRVATIALAAVVLAAAGLAIVALAKWVGPAAPTDATSNGAGASDASRRSSTPADPASAASAQRSAEEPQSDEADVIRVRFDVRGPDDQPPAYAFIAFDSDSRLGPDTLVERWTPEAPAIVLGREVLQLHVTSDSTPLDIHCGDLVADVELDARTPPSQPVLVRLAYRRGICGRVLGGHDERFEVRWCSIETGHRVDSDDLMRAANNAHSAETADHGRAYVIPDLAPGTYAVAVHLAPAGLFEEIFEVTVADRMVRRDVEIARADATTMLHAVVRGLADAELSGVAFRCLGSSFPTNKGEEMNAFGEGSGSFWAAPLSAAPRAALKRVLSGTLESGETFDVVLLRGGAVTSARRLRNGQREVVFDCFEDARLRVKLRPPLEPGATPPRLALVPQFVESLLDDPPFTAGGEDQDATGDLVIFARRVAGEYVLSIWGPLTTAYHHGEVWWPLARQQVTLQAGDQELEVERPRLHPLTIKFDRGRFGEDARVQLRLNRYPPWPIYAQPDANGVARFSGVPAGEYTALVIGDTNGEADLTIPETSELTIGASRRDR